jgi:phosphoribosyl-AMP cyclohydrolase
MTAEVMVVGDVESGVRFNDAGLVPVIVQDANSRVVLMMAWMDSEAIRRTLAEGRVTYFSRSRQEYWRKGDTSGNVQWAKSLHVDCDGDTLLLQVEQTGPACHTGAESCFDGTHS